MNKKTVNYLLMVIAAAIVVVGALFWVLSATINGFEWYKAHYTLYIVLGGPGIISLLVMIFNRNRMWGFIGFVALAAVFISAACWGDLSVWLPFVILLAAGIILYIAVFRPDKYDKGDNQKAGYKNYAERKAEEEAAKKAEDSGKKE